MKISKVTKSIIKVGIFLGAVGGAVFHSRKVVKKETDMKKRYCQYYELTNKWLINKNEGKDLKNFMKENNYNTVAIYGRGTLGELCYEEVKRTGTKIAYFIDKNAEELYSRLNELPVITTDKIKEQENVDAVIITPVYNFDEIKENLADVYDEEKIISLEDVIYSI